MACQFVTNESKIGRFYPELRDPKRAFFDEMVFYSSTFPGEDEVQKMPKPKDYLEQFCDPKERDSLIRNARNSISMELSEQSKLYKIPFDVQRDFKNTMSDLEGELDKRFENPDEKSMSLRQGFNQFLKEVEKEKKNPDKSKRRKPWAVLNGIIGKQGVENLEKSLKLWSALNGLKVAYEDSVNNKDGSRKPITDILFMHVGCPPDHYAKGINESGIKIDGCDFPSMGSFNTLVVELRKDLADFDRLSNDNLVKNLFKLSKTAQQIPRLKAPPPKKEEPEEPQFNKNKGSRNRGRGKPKFRKKR